MFVILDPNHNHEYIKTITPFMKLGHLSDDEFDLLLSVVKGDKEWYLNKKGYIGKKSDKAKANVYYFHANAHILYKKKKDKFLKKYPGIVTLYFKAQDSVEDNTLIDRLLNAKVG